MTVQCCGLVEPTRRASRTGSRSFRRPVALRTQPRQTVLAAVYLVLRHRMCAHGKSSVSTLAMTFVASWWATEKRPVKVLHAFIVYPLLPLQGRRFASIAATFSRL